MPHILGPLVRAQLIQKLLETAAGCPCSPGQGQGPVYEQTGELADTTPMKDYATHVVQSCTEQSTYPTAPGRTRTKIALHSSKANNLVLAPVVCGLSQKTPPPSVCTTVIRDYN